MPLTSSRRCLAALLLALAAALPAHAGDSHLLRISATVLARASLHLRQVPAALAVSAADVARGYVDVAAPMDLAVRSNSPRGFMLMFTTVGDYVRQASVQGLPAPLQLGQQGGAVLLPPEASNGALSLTFRIFLAPSTPAGVHAWPIQLAAAP